MKIGLCCSAEAAPEAIAAGFDYVELAALALTNGADYSGLGCEACNAFFPWNRSLWREFSLALRHARQVVERASEQGIQVLVVGSGTARCSLPEWPAGKGDEFFARLIGEIHAIAAPYGIAVAPESLRREESTVAVDYAALDDRLAAAGLPVVCDAYHLMCEAAADGVDVDWDKLVKRSPIHVHLAAVPRRDVPELDDVLVLGFLRRLAALGYSRRISMEGSLNVSMAEACSRLKTMANAAGLV